MRKLEENIFKSCLKGKVKFTTSALVKFLITGTVALSLTACGGGGGGSSSSGTIFQDKFVSKEVTQNTEINEKMDLSSVNADSVIAVLGHNSEIRNKSDIKVHDKTDSSAKIAVYSSEEAKNVLDFYQKNGESFAIFSENGKVINEKDASITITGDKVTGILGLYSEITNEGKIITSDNVKDSVKATGIISLGADVTNNGTIKISSYEGIGIYAMNNIEIQEINTNINTGKTIEVINNGEISIKGEESRGIVATGNDILVTNNGTLSVEGVDVDGIVGQEGKNIIIKNTATGKILVTNNGGAKTEEWLSGINIKEDGTAEVINEGLIKVTINSKDSNYHGRGIDGRGKITNGETGTIEMSAEGNSELIGINLEKGEAYNSGNIKITANFIKFPEGSETLNDSILLGQMSKGMYTKDEKLINEEKGTITVSGSSIGMFIQGNGTATNKGTIDILGKTADAGEYMTGLGMVVQGSGTIVNDGTIKSNVEDLNGMLALNGGKAINNKNIELKKSEGMTAENNSTVTNGENGIITISGEESIGMRADSNSAAINNGTINTSENGAWGMEAGFGSTATNNKLINVSTSEFLPMSENIIIDAAKGMYAVNGKITNGTDGTIKVSGSIGMLAEEIGEAENNGTIIIEKIEITETDKEFFVGAGMIGTGVDAKVKNNGTITSEMSGSIGILANSGTVFNGDENSKDTAKIILTGDKVIGMESSQSSEMKNYGTITLTGKEAVGMKGRGTSTLENNGEIIVESAGESYGIKSSDDGSRIINTGNIYVKGTDKYVEGGEWVGASGITIGGVASTAINKGTIIAVGDNARGMQAEKGAEAINEGMIKVDGEDAFGMVADGAGSKVTNKKDATIEIKSGSGAMFAYDGGEVINEGKIIIDSTLNVSEESKESWAFVGDAANIKNSGSIEVNGTVEIIAPNMGKYIIGTNKDGSYGKLSAENISLDGNVEVSAEIAKKDYKNSYVLDNAFSGKTELEKDYRLTSSSLLYTAQSTTDKEGNLDVELVRNGNNTADFTDKNFKQAAEVFDKAINNEEYRSSLSEKEKELVEKIFDRTGSAAKINDTVKEISGYEYGNLARQIFDTKDMFKSYDKSIIDSLGDYNFNFNFIGAYADVDSKHGVAGYDSKVTGIAGAMKFTDSLYGVIGYGYNDIDYDGSSDGKIQTIHTGLYKDMKSVYGDVRFGVFAEYNFHETDRKVLDERADSDFDSYLAGVEAEVSRKFGDDLYIKPALSLDVSYGKYEDFTESGSSVNLKVESQDYVSVVPALELKAGKVLGMSEVYTAVKYSYEFGDMNKSQDMELIEKFSVENDNIENAQTDIKVGTVLNIKNIFVNAEIGKEFGKRDKEYVKAGFSYTF